MSQVVAFRRFETSTEAFSTSIHGPSYGLDVYANDPIKASFSTSTGTTRFEGLPVFRISPLGVQIDISSLSNHHPEPGSKLDLSIHIGASIYPFNGVVVSNRVKVGEKDIIGIRWCTEPGTKDATQDRRTGQRWLCGDGFLPTGIAANPVRFNDFIYFSIADISASGVQLTTSLRNKLLIPGMSLDAIVSFPLVGQVSMTLKILNARNRRDNGKETLGLGAQIVTPDKHLNEAIAQYLLQFGRNVSNEDLRAQGLRARSVGSAIEYSFVRTAEEYKEVLALRKLAYSRAGKAPIEGPDETLGDIFDTRARIFLARHHGKAVGTFRLIFFDPEEQTEHERFVKFPENFPRRDEMVNASRLCTHPDYRGSDLFNTIVRQMALAVVQSKKRWLVSGCTPSLLPIYERFGFRGTGIKFKHGDLNAVEEELILWDAWGAIMGTSVGPVIWNKLYSDLFNHLVTSHRIEVDSLTNLRVRAYSTLSPFIKALR